jgi:hypothetical protein
MPFGGEKFKECLTNLGAGFSHADGNKFENQSFDFTRCEDRNTPTIDEKKPADPTLAGLR